MTITADSSAPSGISATVSGGYYTALSIPVTLDNGSDTGSGIDAASGIVERDEAPLDNGDGSCDAFPGSWWTVTLSGGNDTTVASGNVLPLPLPPLRPGRQPGHLGRQRDRQGRHERPGRAQPQLRLARRTRPSRATPSTTARRRRTGQFAGDRSRERRAVGHRLAQLPGRGFGLERLRLGQRAHLQPLRLAERSGRAERRHGHERRRSRLPGSGLHGHAGRAAPRAGISASVSGGYYTATSIAVTLDNGSDSGSGIDAATRHRRARRGSARQRRRHLRRLPGLLEHGHALRRQRHDRRQRQVLPLPLPPLQTGSATRPPRAPARLPRSTPPRRQRRASATARSRTQSSTSVSSTTAPARRAASSRSPRLRATASPASPMASRPPPPAGAPPARATRAPTATPARPSDPAEPNDVTAINGAGLTSGADELHRHL